jgi:hypothetical protein
VSKCSSGMWGTARAAHWHAGPGEHRSSMTWETTRAAQRGVRAGEHCSSETFGTARAAKQSFSSVGENALYKAEVQEALAHRDVR